MSAEIAQGLFGGALMLALGIAIHFGSKLS